MRIRVRGPTGQSIITLQPNSTVGDLRAKIVEATSIEDIDIKIGYPPKPLGLDEHPAESLITSLGTKVDGEQLIVSQRLDTKRRKDQDFRGGENPEPTNLVPSQTRSSQNNYSDAGPSSATKDAPAFSFANVGTAPPQSQSPQRASITKPAKQIPPLSLTRRATNVTTEPPEVPLPTHGSTLVMRIMPDDNSCLFRAINSAYFTTMDNMHELRSIVAVTIQRQPEQYPAWALEKNADDYCRWIQREDAWGGFIELDILSKYLAVEICSIDVQTLRVDHFNEGCQDRCILVYSGIHYDVIASSPSDPPYTHAYAPPDVDTKIFRAHEDVVLEAAVELCRKLQEQHYYTDTASFMIKCNDCGKLCIGEKGATEHAQDSGHYDFGESA